MLCCSCSSQKIKASPLRGSLRRPLRVAPLATVLVLEVFGIRLDVQNVTERLIRLGRTRLIGTGNRLQMRQRRVEFRVLVQLTLCLFLICSGIEHLFQHKGLGCRCRLHGFLIATVQTVETIISARCHEKVILANGTESHQYLLLDGPLLGVTFYGDR